ncbi:efflux RND transporter periplasmic adaptor subunit [Aliiroseovarius subalbicans]|uniref:efflux RND transporter periplasmic adaptor subunit n=1 Tax=Aliiroseovarius subalbicans TaxID=2925840 RepID=UPI001F56E7D9|nr:efflux RND transporter periplasmic adaptor subunit [Aliiroseovarius subalbicans]MCI2398685.1 efflux RND transporter periplasmic adaptor subunit [Aliiroseovarius subalbicans]
MRLVPILTALLVVAVLFLAIFQRDSLLNFARGEEPSAIAEVDDAPVDDTPEATGVSVIALKSQVQRIDSAVLVRGRTEAARQVALQAETSGQVVSPPLRKGAFVEAGQVMCQIDPGTREASLAEAKARLAEANANLPQIEARVIEAQARLDEALINLNAAEKLSEGGFATETRLASAKAGVEAARAGLIGAKAGTSSTEAAIQSAEAGVAAASREIERLSITAPFAGHLETDTAELGSLLQPGALCATIVQLDPIKLIGFVPELEVDKVKTGVPAGARLANGKEVQGIVRFLSRSADATTRTFRVEVEVANADLAIRDGQTAEIIIAADGRMAHLVPQSSLTLSDDGTLGLRIAQDGKAMFVAVDMIRDTVDGVWVAGLPDQADIIVLGQEYVADGVAVDVTYREPDA